MRSMMMLGGLISFNLNPMSIFSYPLELGLKAGFINPRYGVDDIIAKVTNNCYHKLQVKEDNILTTTLCQLGALDVQYERGGAGAVTTHPLHLRPHDWSHLLERGAK